MKLREKSLIERIWKSWRKKVKPFENLQKVGAEEFASLERCEILENFMKFKGKFFDWTDLKNFKEKIKSFENL